MQQSGRVDQRVIDTFDQSEFVEVGVNYKLLTSSQQNEPMKNSRSQQSTRVKDEILALLSPANIPNGNFVCDGIPFIIAKLDSDGVVKLLADERVIWIGAGGKSVDFRLEGRSNFGITEVHNQGFTGINQHVAFIESWGFDIGTQGHSDFTGLNIVSQKCWDGQDDSFCQDGPDSAKLWQNEFHGTHMLGIAYAQKSGVNEGSAPSANFTLLRAGNPFDKYKALCYIRDTAIIYNYDAVNMSWGIVSESSQGFTESFYDDACDCFSSCVGIPDCNECSHTQNLLGYSEFTELTQQIHDLGIPLVAATGNFGVGTVNGNRAQNFGMSGIPMPACLSSTISVGGVYDLDKLTYDGTQSSPPLCVDVETSDYIGQEWCAGDVGDSMDLYAPGAMIDSSLAGSDSGETVEAVGTSQAAVFVSSCIALLRQKFPNTSIEDIREALKGSPQAERGFSVLNCEAASQWLVSDTADIAVAQVGMPSCQESISISNQGVRDTDNVKVKIEMLSVTVPGPGTMDAWQDFDCQSIPGSVVGAGSLVECDMGHFRVSEEKIINFVLQGESSVSVQLLSSSRAEANTQNNLTSHPAISCAGELQ